MDKHLLIYKCQALFENSFLPSALAKAKGKPNREWMPDDIRIKVLKPGTRRGAALYGENIHGADCICDCDGSPSDDCHAHCTVAHGEKACQNCYLVPAGRRNRMGAEKPGQRRAGDAEPMMNNGTKNDLRCLLPSC